MKHYIKLSLKLLISIALFVVFVAFTETKKEEPQTSSQLVARRGGRGHGGHRRGRSRGHRGGGIEFRFNIGPSRRQYYDRPYYREYVRVRCTIYDDKYSRVTEVQVGGRSFYVNGSRGGQTYYFSVRPGYHTLKWRVANEDRYGTKYRNYSRSFRVYRDREQIDITIRGSSASIR